MLYGAVETELSHHAPLVLSTHGLAHSTLFCTVTIVHVSLSNQHDMDMMHWMTSKCKPLGS